MITIAGVSISMLSLVLTGLAILLVLFAIWHWARSRRVNWSGNYMDYVEFGGWLMGWFILNGVANANGSLVIVDILEARLGAPLPTMAHDALLWFLIGIFPSIGQFNFQVDPMRVLSRDGRLFGNVVLTLIDGLLATVGVYYFLLPLDLSHPLNVEALWASIAAALFGCYLCQYMAHNQAYHLANLEPPKVPLPALLSALVGVLTLRVLRQRLIMALSGQREVDRVHEDEGVPPVAGTQGRSRSRIDHDDIFKDD